MRDKFWRFAVRNHPEGEILTWWLMTLRTILFPLDTFYWRYGSKNGYDLRRNEWNIHGIKYTDEALRALSKSQGEVFKITKVGESITLERIDTY